MQTAGSLNTSGLAEVQSGWDTFSAAIEAAGFPLVVVSPLNADSKPVTAIVARPYLKTQRRRARR
jgi:hypothetical protein